MILVIYQLEVLLDKRKEFLQVVPMIFSTTAQQQGCVRHHICQDFDDNNSFFVLQEWENQTALDAHWQSDPYAAFLGSFHLLKRAPYLQIHAVSFTAGMEAIKAARNRSKIPNMSQNETEPAS
jgi:quinol monooxygenase YgiN